MNGLYTRAFAAGLFPLHERLKGHQTVAVRRALERTQWWSPERLRGLQAERLSALLVHAARHVPYYRALCARHRVDPAEMPPREALARLPLLDKAAIRAAPEALRSERARALQPLNTGGSSGEPLVFWVGKERVSHDVAAKWRATRWWNVDIGDPEVVVWGSPVELSTQDRLKALRDRLQRSLLLPAFEMSPQRLRGFVAAIRRRRPRMLFGYPSALAHIAEHAEREGVRVDDLGVRVAFVTAERLYPYQREVIERIFGCPVANGYGGRDSGFIAHECPEGGLHVTSEDVVVEIVDEHGAPRPVGESGEIVVTHLASRDYPFIRYRTGDVGALASGPCRCGRGLALLARVEGRTTDFVVAEDGTVMHGLALIYVVRGVRGVRGFRIIQESLSHTRLLLAVDEGFDEEALRGITAGFRARLGPGVAVTVERCPELPPERSGKFRYVISHVDPCAVAGEVSM